MNLSPWIYWTAEKQPRPQTQAMLDVLDRVNARNAKHAGACHLWIHAVEAAYPKRAEACADRLAALMPGAGHIVHMPGHIYIRVGRWADAIEANRHAVHADETYLEGPQVSREGIYPQGYYPHNYHFMSFAASMAGNGETALYAARKVVETLGPDVVCQQPWLENVTPIVYWTLVNFGRWDDVLAEPLPPPDLRFGTGMAYYARGVALAAKGRWEEAGAALDTVAAVAENFPEGGNRVALHIARHVLMGEIAQRHGYLDDAIGRFRTAAELEDGLGYLEPPTWYYPVRHSLGKALLAAKRAAEAEVAYRQDLKRFPENGWALLGLAQSLEMQGKLAEANDVRRRFEAAWRGADVELVASRF
jgi:predicted Zn-dependent protease